MMLFFVHKNRKTFMKRKRIRKQEEGEENSGYRALHDAADDHQPELFDAFINAIALTQGAIEMERVRDALRESDFQRVNNIINWDLFRLEFGNVARSILKAIINQAGNNAINLLPNEARIGISFDVENPRVSEWLEVESGRLIRQVTEESRLAIGNQLARANRQGLGIDETANIVREYIGLTERQMNAVDNLRSRLIEDGISQSQAFQRSVEYRNRLLDFRAENISRTESINASRQGAVELMNQGIEQNALDKRNYEKVWIVTGDDRTCPICRPLHGLRTSIDGLFQTGAGMLEGPTAHPQCRCAIHFERVELI